MSIFMSCCLVLASNGRHSPSSGFPNCPQPQLLASHVPQLQLPTNSTMDVPLLPGPHPHRLVAILHQPPTLLTAISRLFHNGSRSSLYILGMDGIEIISIIAYCLAAGETCPQSCSLATAVLLSPVYTAVTW
jgi:hypothetical protein